MSMVKSANLFDLSSLRRIFEDRKATLEMSDARYFYSIRRKILKYQIIVLLCNKKKTLIK